MTVGVNDDYLVTNTITKVNERIMESAQELLQLYQCFKNGEISLSSSALSSYFHKPICREPCLVHSRSSILETKPKEYQFNC